MIEELISSDLARELIVVIIAALPIIELRGALPVAINLLHMPWYWAFCLSVIGSLLPVPILLLFFESDKRMYRSRRKQRDNSQHRQADLVFEALVG